MESLRVTVVPSILDYATLLTAFAALVISLVTLWLVTRKPPIVRDIKPPPRFRDIPLRDNWMELSHE